MVAGLLVDIFFLALLGVVMARVMRRRPTAGPWRAVAIASIPVALLSLGIFSALQNPADPKILELRKVWETQFQGAASTLSGSIDPVKAQEFASLTLRLYPGLQCLFWVLALVYGAWVLRIWMSKRGATTAAPALSRWRLPFGLIWLVILPAAIVLLGDRGWLGETSKVLRELSLNLLVVSLGLHAYQGAMVVADKLSGWGLPKVVAHLGALTLALVAMVPAGHGIGLGLLALGLFDPFADFRGMNRPKVDPDNTHKETL